MLKKLSFFAVMGFFSFSSLQASEPLKEERLKVTSTRPILWQLPSVDVLEQNIRKVTSPYFIEKTQLPEKLGGEKRYDLGIDMAIECSYYDFFEYLQRGGLDKKSVDIMKIVMIEAKPALKQAILKDPKEIKSE